MKAIILAGGKGTRLRSATRKPKLLVKVGRLTLIDHLVQQLFQSGVVSNIIFSLGHRSNEIRSHLETYPSFLRDRFNYSYERKMLGTGGAIARALDGVDDDELVLAINGDILSDMSPVSLLDHHALHQKRNPHAVTLAGTTIADISDCGHLQVNKNTNLVHKFEEKNGQKREGIISAGWYVFKKHTFNDHKPASEVFSIEHDFFPQLASMGHIKMYHHRGRWSNVGTPEVLDEVRRIYQEI